MSNTAHVLRPLTLHSEQIFVQDGDRVIEKSVHQEISPQQFIDASTPSVTAASND